MRRLRVRRDDWDEMRAHVESCLPHEGCGLLAGHGDTVDEVLPIANQAHSPTRFRMDPAEQIQAFDHLEAERMDLLGIFHSHPAAEGAIQTGPSPTDIGEAAYPVVQVVWSHAAGEWQARGFWIEGGNVSNVELRIEDGKSA